MFMHTILASFYGVLLLRYLIEFKDSSVQPIILNGKLISIKFTFTANNKSRTLVFKDSFLLLPLSLRNLCEDFDLKKLLPIFIKLN